MEKEIILDAYYMEARANLLEVAAFIDRIERAGGQTDFRWHQWRECLPLLTDNTPQKVRRILEHLSDPTTEPVDRAPGKGACGAWPGKPSGAGGEQP